MSKVWECCEVIASSSRIRKRAGCCLHIVLDDFNLETEHVLWCHERAAEEDHPKCFQLASLMLDLDEDERLEVANYYLKA